MRRMLGFIAVLAVVLLAGAWSAAQDRPVLRVAVQADPSTLDPHDVSDVPSRGPLAHMLDTLVTIDDKNNVAPSLATAWEFRAGGKQIVFKLRPGVKFHDGTDLTPDVVKWNLERIVNPENKLKGLQEYNEIESVDVVDASTVRLNLKAPSGPIVRKLASAGASIMSRAHAEKKGKDLRFHPVGTGPYQFVEWLPKERLVMKAFDGHWGGRPKLSQIVLQPTPVGATRVTLLESGEVEVAAPIPIPDVERLRGNPRLKVESIEGNDNLFLFVNTLKKPLDDVRVRRALNYAVDRDALVKTIYRGMAKPLTDSPIGPRIFGHASQGPYYDYDPERAKRLLAEARVSGLKLKMWVPDGRYLMDKEAGEAVAGMLQKVGVDVEVSKFEWGTYIGKIIRVSPTPPPDYDLLMLTFATAVGDADGAMAPILKSTGWPPKHYNWAFYKNAKVDELLDRGRDSVEPAQRQAAYKEAQKLVMEDAPWVFLVVYQYTAAFKREVQGLQVVPYGAVIVRDASIAR